MWDDYNLRMKKVGIVVVTYNRYELLKEVIDALRQQTYQDFQIIVVNNGSTDGTSNWLSLQEDIITITQRNVGGAGGFYTGMKFVAENGYELCWIMDDDVICKDNSLEELLEGYKIVGEAGFLCSKVIGLDGTPMNVPYIDERHTADTYPNYYQFIEDQILKVKRATFVSVIFSSEIIRKVGLPIKEFFIWGDDSEFTLRISKLLPCYLCCRSIVVHKRAIQGNITFESENNPNRIKNYFYLYRNHLYIDRKYVGIKAFVLSYCRLFSMCVNQFLRFKWSKFLILLKVLVCSPTFNPKVQYPK